MKGYFKKQKAGCNPPKGCFECPFEDCYFTGSKTSEESLFTKPAPKKMIKEDLPIEDVADPRGRVLLPEMLPDMVLEEIFSIYSAGWY